MSLATLFLVLLASVVYLTRASQSDEAHYSPPPKYEGDFGTYRSPLRFYDGREVTTPAEWSERRAEILERWHGLMGAWPPLIDRPKIVLGESTRAGGHTRYVVDVEVAPDGRTIRGFLIVPHGEGPFPAVLVPYYEPETVAGLKKSMGDFGFQLAERGFVALAIGWPEIIYYPTEEAAELQPLSMLAYIAANCWQALAQLPYVDSRRIGVIGQSFGGKWALFASCLFDKFTCAVWSDPAIVFDETLRNANYWEPWYLGYELGKTRVEGMPTEANPRTGAYKEMVEAGLDLHELHALMAPRPFLVSGGVEDPPQRWQALNHTIAVNKLLGYDDRVAMDSRPTHSPTEESNEVVHRFLQRWLGTPDH